MCDEYHAIERAKERYGLELTSRDLLAISKDVEAGNWKLQRARESVDYCIGSYNGVPVRIVYARDKCQVVTFLPLVDDPEWRTAEVAA